MVRIEDFMQLKAFARQDALMLALLWTASFACFMMLNAGALGNLLALATPFFVGWRLVRFRDGVLGGTISFRRAYAYSIYEFAYAALVFALVQFAYFRFLDNGAFASALTESMRTLAPIYKQNGMTQAQLNESMGLVKMLTPVQWAFMFMMHNLFVGMVASLPVAAICMRSRRKPHTTNNQRHNWPWRMKDKEDTKKNGNNI